VSGAESDLIAATPDRRPALARAAAQFSEEDLTRFFQILLQTDDDLRRKPDPRVHLEMGLLRLINAARLAPLEELLAEVRTGAPAIATSAGASAAAPPPMRTVAQTFAPGASATTPFRAESAHTPVSPRTETFARTSPAPTADLAAQPEQASSPIQALGLTGEQVAEIKAAIQSQQKFLGELVEQGSRWELDGSELRIYFSPKNRAFAELLEGRDSLEKVRAVSSKVIGRAVRVCAKLEAVAVAATASASSDSTSSQELRAQFERDPMVRSMLQRFGGRITEVKRSSEES
jgi:DNA polymerase III gamma/tau subunit